MIGEAIQAASSHTHKAAGILVLMGVAKRANIQRLREAHRLLVEAAAQTQLAIDAADTRSTTHEDT